jgi:hypothetical protein
MGKGWIFFSSSFSFLFLFCFCLFFSLSIFYLHGILIPAFSYCLPVAFEDQEERESSWYSISFLKAGFGRRIHDTRYTHDFLLWIWTFYFISHYPLFFGYGMIDASRKGTRFGLPLLHDGPFCQFFVFFLCSVVVFLVQALSPLLGVT